MLRRELQITVKEEIERILDFMNSRKISIIKVPFSNTYYFINEHYKKTEINHFRKAQLKELNKNLALLLLNIGKIKETKEDIVIMYINHFPILTRIKLDSINNAFEIATSLKGEDKVNCEIYANDYRLFVDADNEREYVSLFEYKKHKMFHFQNWYSSEWVLINGIKQKGVKYE